MEELRGTTGGIHNWGFLLQPPSSPAAPRTVWIIITTPRTPSICRAWVLKRGFSMEHHWFHRSLHGLLLQLTIRHICAFPISIAHSHLILTSFHTSSLSAAFTNSRCSLFTQLFFLHLSPRTCHLPALLSWFSGCSPRLAFPRPPHASSSVWYGRVIY